jgi:gluconate 2-dehydrogenase gamma chain
LSTGSLPAPTAERKVITTGRPSCLAQRTRGGAFFKEAIDDVKAGFFADPIYGGNRDMVAWKMIGFPGARYNYLDWIDRHNERYPLPPVSMMGRADWTPKR